MDEEDTGRLPYIYCTVITIKYQCHAKDVEYM